MTNSFSSDPGMFPPTFQVIFQLATKVSLNVQKHLLKLDLTCSTLDSHVRNSLPRLQTRADRGWSVLIGCFLKFFCTHVRFLSPLHNKPQQHRLYRFQPSTQKVRGGALKTRVGGQGLKAACSCEAVRGGGGLLWLDGAAPIAAAVGINRQVNVTSEGLWVCCTQVTSPSLETEGGCTCVDGQVYVCCYSHSSLEQRCVSHEKGFS